MAVSAGRFTGNQPEPCSRRDFLARAGRGGAALALSGALGGVLLDGCGTGPADGGLATDQVLRVPLSSDPGTLDVNLQQWSYEAQVGRNMFETLLRPKVDLSDVEGAAAESWLVSPDGLTWTFTLRRDGRWSDGKPVVARDFLYAFQRMLDPSLGAPYAGVLQGIVKGGEQARGIHPHDTAAVQQYLRTLAITAADDHTLVVGLQRPDPTFKWVLASWATAPVRDDVVTTDPTGWASNPRTAVSNGWFRLAEHVPQHHVTLVPNDHYWGARPKLARLLMPVIRDEHQAYAAYQRGELDMAAVPLSETARARGHPDLVKERRLTVTALALNTLAPPFDNARLRQAFARAIDRGHLVSDVLFGRGVATTAPIPSGIDGFSASLAGSQQFDPTTARKLFDDAGVTRATVNALRLDFRSDLPTARTVAEFVANQLNANLGLSIQTNAVEAPALGQHFSSGQFAMMTMADAGTGSPDQQAWLDAFVSPAGPTSRGRNGSGYTNPGYDRMVQQADVTLDPSRRGQLYLEAQRMVCDDAPLVFLYQEVGWCLVKKHVKGTVPLPIDDNPFVGDVDTPAIYITRQ